jgi:hypothetical protein
LSKQTNKSANTGHRYRIAVEKFLAVLGDRQKKPLTSLTANDVELYINSQAKEKLAPPTVILCFMIIRTALNGARRRELIQTNPPKPWNCQKTKAWGGARSQGRK